MMSTSNARRPLALRLAALSLLLLARPAIALTAQEPAPATPPSAELLEPPRLGIAFKGVPAAVASRSAWRTDLAAHGCRPELVALDALPVSVAKAKVPPPRWVIVYENVESEAIGPRTVDYGDGNTQSFRLRFSGAKSRARGKIYELRDKPVEIAALVDQIVEEEPPEEWRFKPAERRKDLTIDPDEQLDRLLARMAGRALALASAIDLWRERATLVERTARLDPETSAAFWRRASAVTLDPWYGTTPVPWFSLETSAVAHWKNAAAAAARYPRPATTCAWCEEPPPAEKSACACPESRALASAKLVLARSFGRKDLDGTRKAALAIEVPFDELDPSRAAKWKAPLAKLEQRLRAEQTADRDRLVGRLGLKADRVRGKQTYAILVLKGPTGWTPSDPDLERHASDLIQAFAIGSEDARSFYGDASRPGLALTRWSDKITWYEPVGRREFKGAPAEIEALVLRALWDNSRGVDTEPLPR